MKRQTTDWEKIFSNHISVKGLVPKIHSELSRLNNKKKNPTLKMSKRYFTKTKKDKQMENKQVKRCTSSSFIRKYKLNLQ